MNNSVRRIFFGAALILIGGLFLAQQIFGLQLHLGALIFASMFALGGAAFIFVLASHKENWWAAIPGMVLLGLAVLIALGQLLPEVARVCGGSIFLAFIGSAFLIVFLVKRDNWWAIIPMGVLFTLALAAWIGSVFNGMAVAAVFFLGIAITFGVIGLLPVGRQEKWPWIPAGICAALGTMLMVGSGDFMSSFAGYVWPGLLVLFGLYFIGRTFLKKN
jgi:hypothetical protein